MEDIFQILRVILFYALMLFLYAYCKGWYNVGVAKNLKYAQWIEKHGDRAAKAIIVLTIFYSVDWLAGGL